MSYFIIRTIAVFEMKTLLRSWFFRIFAGMAIFFLGIFNAALNVPSSGSPWVYRAVAASIPYANLIMLNLGQAIVAVFLASEFLKQDRKNDTVEVIYVRSMSNGAYILGKTLGILAVFFILNLVILAIGVGFSFISNAGSQHILPYLVYPLLISLPTLVFILGLSFFFMVLIRNQAVTFIILLGYIALTIFYLNKKVFHVFDFISYQVPMMYSAISGFGNFTEILIHRCIYFLFGIALILFTVYGLSRLPQKPAFARYPLYVGFLFLIASGFCVFRYIQIKSENRKFRMETLALNNRFANHARVTVRKDNLVLTHKGSHIKVRSNLIIFNSGKEPVDTLIFSLNSGLMVHHMQINDSEVKFLRNLHIIRIPGSSLNPGDSLRLSMEYEGGINENSCFADGDANEFDDNFKVQVFTLRKRFAFLQKDFVCLTSEAQWYPIAGTGYANVVPFRYEPDFTRFTLTVNTNPVLTAISQGKSESPEKGSFIFRPEYPLNKISLLIGNYVQYSTRVDSIDYKLYTIKGHDYYKSLLANVTDTLPELIRDARKDFEVRTELKYPFKRFMLAEVPLHFSLDNPEYSFSSDAVQPELIMYPEKGIYLNNSDFKGELFRRQKQNKNNNVEELPEETQVKLVEDFIRNNFMPSRSAYFEFNGDIKNRDTYSVFPLFYSFITRLQSERWPVLNTAFEAWVSERNNDAGTELEWWQDLTAPEKINIELRHTSLKEVLKTGIQKGVDRGAVTTREVAVAKGNFLFNLLCARFGETAVDTFMMKLINHHTHGIIPFEEADSLFRKQFQASLAEQCENWYVQKNLPGFVVNKLSAYKVKDGESTRYQVRFNLSNAEAVDGMVTLNIELSNQNRSNEENQENFKVDYSRKVFIPAHSSFDIGMIFNSEPARMSMVTHISQNLPYNMIFPFTGFVETKNVLAFDGMRPVPFLPDSSNNNEIVIDNEDPGFSEHQVMGQAYLKSLVDSKNRDRYKYISLHTWNPPREWKSALRSEFFGRYVHSASYTRAGTGERTAVWVAQLPHNSTCDVYFYLNKLNGVWRRTQKAPDYNFLVYDDEGVHPIKKSSADADDGWNYLGTFTFRGDSGRIELSNKTAGDMILADAMKWILRD